MKARQHGMEAKMDELLHTVRELQGKVHTMKEIQEDLEIFKSNTNDVWQRLKTDEQRLNKLEINVMKLETTTEGNMLKVEDWFVEFTTRASTAEVPKEIINSLREVINNSSPGIAVEGMRAEIEEIRDSVDQN
ncbi:hypothetical protein, partial [Klebsiella aerogenes]|uniref:hypothetical protein n=1 Tax=Klebsiella aerogenes TaxID=548 RepID=UPI001CC541FF